MVPAGDVPGVPEAVVGDCDTGGGSPGGGGQPGMGEKVIGNLTLAISDFTDLRPDMNACIAVTVSAC